ncbi:Swi5-domain-containing protein [Lentithecium fluviatile CBS 122367]|uniref:Swi5-domain-containing protein n=1 Tax=Lentithecium fluviatile CBS 122367 TaxID=1168545 RepID=A0A6G1IL73_9PLEO|nr:Swi5-domain-containing protein [Lentithecium fluviatile CBS 122367]
MTFGAGVAEIPDSEDEPFTSSPQVVSDGAVGERLPAEQELRQEAPHETGRLHQASDKNASSAGPGGDESLTDHRNTSLAVKPSDHRQSANLHPNTLLQQQGDSACSRSVENSPMQASTISQNAVEEESQSISEAPQNHLSRPMEHELGSLITKHDVRSTDGENEQEPSAAIQVHVPDLSNPLASSLSRIGEPLSSVDSSDQALQSDSFSLCDSTNELTSAPGSTNPCPLPEHMKEGDAQALGMQKTSRQQPVHNAGAPRAFSGDERSDCAHSQEGEALQDGDSGQTLEHTVIQEGAHQAPGTLQLIQPTEDGGAPVNVDTRAGIYTKADAMTPPTEAAPVAACSIEHMRGREPAASTLSSEAPVDASKEPAAPSFITDPVPAAIPLRESIKEYDSQLEPIIPAASPSVETPSALSSSANTQVTAGTDLSSFAKMDIEMTPSRPDLQLSQQAITLSPALVPQDPSLGNEPESEHTSKRSSHQIEPADQLSGGERSRSSDVEVERQVPTMSLQPQRQANEFPKPIVGQKRPAPANTQQETVLAELKAQRAALIASLAALPHIRDLVADKDSGDEASEHSDGEPTDAEITAVANKLVKNHIKLLHEYNEIKDVGQGLMGLIADQRGVRIVEVQDEYGLDSKD